MCLKTFKESVNLSNSVSREGRLTKELLAPMGAATVAELVTKVANTFPKENVPKFHKAAISETVSALVTETGLKSMIFLSHREATVQGKALNLDQEVVDQVQSFNERFEIVFYKHENKLAAIYAKMRSAISVDGHVVDGSASGFEEHALFTYEGEWSCETLIPEDNQNYGDIATVHEFLKTLVVPVVDKTAEKEKAAEEKAALKAKKEAEKEAAKAKKAAEKASKAEKPAKALDETGAVVNA